MSYKKLQGKCKYCLGCTRLEDEKFIGTDNCIWAYDPIKHIHEILGIKGEHTNDND